MRRHTTTALLTALLAFLALATAQTAPAFQIAFVDTQALIRAHPAEGEISRLSAALDSELQELLGQRDALLVKAENEGLSAEEEELLQALSVTIQTRRDSGLADIRDAAAPAEQAANQIIREIAAAEGYALVLDIEAASGLVVYAAEAVPDMTEAAVVVMEERFSDEE